MTAEVFHVSAFIQEEMEARGWTLHDLERESGLPFGRLAAIMDGEDLTYACTRGLGKAFGTSADLWEHLDAAWWASLEAYSRGGLRAGMNRTAASGTDGTKAASLLLEGPVPERQTPKA